MSQPPNVDFGSPAIFFDSHPSEQESYLYSYWSSLKNTLHIAWTGQVPKPLEPGTLRVVFWTHENTQGIKDYELHEYILVQESWEELCKQDEVRRCLVMGYSGQNPYVRADGGSNPWVEKFQRDQKRERERARQGGERMDNSKEGRVGKLIDIEEVIHKSEELEEERRMAQPVPKVEHLEV
jgi:hypothetical protein